MSFLNKKKKYKIDSKEVGLEIEFLALNYLLKLEHLHYGYFKDGLEASVSNLKKAQDNYEELLISNIPEGTKSILDVGCGAGRTAMNMTLKGYSVDCVSPNQRLTDYARKLTGDKVGYYPCKLQDLKSDVKYDLILFSESLQYVPVDKGIPLALQFLRPGGYIMVSDFFRNDPEFKSKLGGGHRYDKWLKWRATFPVKTIIEKDITAETSPTVDIFNQFTQEVIKPSWESVWALGEDRFPLIIKIAKRLYRKKIYEMEQKHFTGQRSGENFRKYKKYMFYLFQAEN
jgi:2-polyprenyl-3-methyl-5-hydroxy-6-metoxy-1,4-benzoquinol methylase